MLFIEYPKCTTCQKAAKWLTENGFSFDRRHIKDHNQPKRKLEHGIRRADYRSNGFLIPAAFYIKNWG